MTFHISSYFNNIGTFIIAYFYATIRPTNENIRKCDVWSNRRQKYLANFDKITKVVYSLKWNMKMLFYSFNPKLVGRNFVWGSSWKKVGWF